MTPRADSGPGSPRLGRAAEVLRRTPRAVRLLLLVAVIVAVSAAVVLPLFTGGGAPEAQVTGFIPPVVSAGRDVRVDIGVDNIGDSIISPLCLSLRGSGAQLESADFLGLETLTASGNRVCGGALTAQETISVTLTFRISRPVRTTVSVLPQQGGRVIGPAFATQVVAR